MGFGVLEPKDASAHVPGTSLLDVHEQVIADNSGVLKKGTGRNSHVILVPQPSDDPNDPLVSSQPHACSEISIDAWARTGLYGSAIVFLC